MGIPHNARKLLRQRRRVLKALRRTGQVIVPAIPAQAQGQVEGQIQGQNQPPVSLPDSHQ